MLLLWSTSNADALESNNLIVHLRIWAIWEMVVGIRCCLEVVITTLIVYYFAHSPVVFHRKKMWLITTTIMRCT